MSHVCHLIVFVLTILILLSSCGPVMISTDSSQEPSLKVLRYILNEQGEVVSDPITVTHRILHPSCFGAIVVKKRDASYVYLGEPAPVSSVLVSHTFFSYNPFRTLGKTLVSDGRITVEPSTKPFCAVWIDVQGTNRKTGVELVFSCLADVAGIFYATQGGPGVMLRRDGLSDYSYAMVEFNVSDGIVSLVGAQMVGIGKTGKSFSVGERFSTLVEVFDGVVRVFSGRKLVALFVGPGLNTTQVNQGLCFGIFSFGKITLERFCVYSYDEELPADLTREYILPTSFIVTPEQFYENSSKSSSRVVF